MQQKRNAETTEWDHLFENLDNVERNPFKRKATFHKIKDEITQSELKSNRLYHFKKKAISFVAVCIVLVGALYVWQNASQISALLFQGDGQETALMNDYLTKPEVPYVALKEGVFILNRDFPGMHRENYEYAASIHGDIVVDPHAYDYEGYQRGEVVYYQIPEKYLYQQRQQGIGERVDQETTTISRIIGLPGETVKIAKGQVYINGKRLDTFYGQAHRMGISANMDYQAAIERLYMQPQAFVQLQTSLATMAKEITIELTVPPGHLFLIGDDWYNSIDSISLGPIPFENIEGKVLGYHEANLGKATMDELVLYLETQPNVYGITRSPDEQTVAYVVGDIYSWEGQMHLWQLGQDQPQAIDLEHRITGFYWSPDSSHVLVDIGTSATRFGEVIHRDSGQKRYSFMFMSMRWSPDSQKIVYGSISDVQLNVDLELFGTVDIAILDLQTGEVSKPVLGTPEVYYYVADWVSTAEGDVIIYQGVKHIEEEEYHYTREEYFGALLYPEDIYTNPETVVRLWSEGLKSRNGRLQLAMLAPEVQKQVASYYEESGWSTGTSSPWIENLEIEESGVEQNKIEYVISYSYATSTGSAGGGVATITVTKLEGGLWYITDIKAPGEPYYLNLPKTN